MDNKTRKPLGIPVKIAIYIRTTANNVDYLHDEYLDVYKNYDIVQFYLDDINGKQPAFNQLLADAKNREFEVVITKSIMNFEDTQILSDIMQTLRTFKQPIAIYFEDENLFSFDIEERYKKKLRERFFGNLQVVNEDEWRKYKNY